MNGKMRSQLAAHIAAQDYININKRDEDNPSQCIPLGISDSLLLGLSFRDFCPDGYEIVPLEQIVSVTHSEVDAYFGDIVKKEGAVSLIESAPQIDLTDWPSVFRFLMETGEIVIVDIGREGCIDVGKVMEVAAESIEMRRFDAIGVWEQENWCEFYDDLTGVKIRDPYTQTFAKYLPPL